MRILFLVLFMSLGYWWWQYAAVISHPAGVLVTGIPVQETVQKSPWIKGRYQIKPLAKFSLEARVIRKQRYHDRGAEIAPYDLVLGWRQMSDQALLDQLKISQVWRWWQWHAKMRPTVPPRTIETSASNMHIIPASEDIERKVAHLRQGDIIFLRGYLVSVQGPDGFRWRSSLSRHDTGDGACELFWVEEISIVTDRKID